MEYVAKLIIDCTVEADSPSEAEGLIHRGWNRDGEGTYWDSGVRGHSVSLDDMTIAAGSIHEYQEEGD